MAVSMNEEIDELRRKIALLDGDKKAYYESTQWEMKKNQEYIAKLRLENKKMRENLAKKMRADEDVIAEVFRRHNMKMPPELRGKPMNVALQIYDQKVCEGIKRYNHLKHVRKTREQKLDSLVKQLDEMRKECQAINSTPAGDSEAAKTVRHLENRLDKAVMKCNEAEHIRKTYEAILQALQEERLEFDNKIVDLKKSIKASKQDLEQLESMYCDAQLARDNAKAELVRQEQSMAESRKEREVVLADYRKRADEKKEFAEKVERRLRRTSTTHSIAQSLDILADSVQEVQEAKITNYEEALAKIKDATGVSDIQEVVDRFLNQGDTKRHLEQLREENTKLVARLKEEKEKLQAQFEDMKYSGEAKTSAGQRMLEEFETHLSDAKQKCSESEEKANRASNLLAKVKNGVEHLSEKLQHIKAPHTHVLKPKVDPGSEEYVLEQLSVAEQKLVGLAEELSSRDLDTIKKEMADEEFRHSIEGGVAGNVKVELPKGTKKPAFYDEDSASDDDFMSRESIKKNTAALVEAKTKKKSQDDDDEDDKKKKKKRR